MIARARRYAKCFLAAGVLALVCVDLARVDRAGGERAWLVPEVDPASLGEATVVVVSSDNEQLPEPAPLDARLSYAQVDAMVKRAIRLDTSEHCLARVVQAGDRVGIKVNIVTAPLVTNGRRHTAFWDSGKPHWGQVTDLRVVRSVVDYLINEERDARRITIVEGPAEWAMVGREGAESGQTEDGWTVHWEEFGGLSYADIVAQYNGVNGVAVDIVDLNYDDWVGTGGVNAGEPLPVPDPHGTGIGAYQRPEGYYVSETLLDLDRLVNIAVMKTHNIPGVTLLHKQYVGTLMQRAYGTSNSSKGALHSFGDNRVPWGFVDLFCYRPTDYGIIEGIWGTEGAGPQWGDDVQHNVIVAGGDPVATDAAGATVMGFNPADLVFLRLSAAKGFGTYYMDYVDIVGDPLERVQRDFVKTPDNPFWGWGNRRWLVNGPHAADDLTSAPLGDEAALLPADGQAAGGTAWRAVSGPDRLFVFPGEQVAPSSVTYAFAYIASARDQDGFLYLGADDGAKVWLNGQLVHAAERMEALPTSARVAVSLYAGLNPVLVKVRNRFGRSGLILVAGDKDGDTLPGIEYLLGPRPPDTAVTGEAAGLPARFALERNYPNPFNAGTSIPYWLPGSAAVRLAIHDARGALVRVLVDATQAGGRHLVEWDGRDGQGDGVATGVYLCELRTPWGRQTGRMLLLQ